MSAEAAPSRTAAAVLRPAFVFDANRCTGCDACRLACTIENRLPWATSWRQVLTFNPGRTPSAPLFHLSIACNHCERPPCMEACPALAYRRDANGAVAIDPGRCIGCGYCTWACPYDAPRMDERAGVMTKCTFCTHRLSDGLAPACASVCPTGALSFERLPAARLVQPLEGFPDAGIGPSIRIVPLRNGRQVPTGLIAAAGAPGTAPATDVPRRIGLAHEWSLVVFTLVLAVLVALAGRAALGWGGLPLPAFVAAIAAAMALGALHLRRKERAWRAILNLRSSWLSREIAAIGLFAAVTSVWLIAGSPGAWPARIAVLASGTFVLLAVDRVYRYALLAPFARPHSAGMLPSSVFVLGVLSGRGDLALAVGLLQLVLYLRRQRGRARAGSPLTPWAVARVGLGFALPLALWALPGPWARAVAIAAAGIGLLVDRAEFYLDLAFRSPQRQMAEDLERRLEAGGDGSGLVAAARATG